MRALPKDNLYVKMTTLNFLLNRYGVRGQKSPINLPYKRWSRFPELIKELGFTSGAEVGVERGRFAKNMVRYNPQLKLFAVDAWKTYRDYDGLPLVNQEVLSSYYLKAKQTLKPYNVQIIKDFSMDAVKKFANKSLDFVYIDANHRYEYCLEDIGEWSKKVKKGGLVAGHSYFNGIHSDLGGMQTNYGVRRAVDRWVKENNIKYLFVLAKDQVPSWMFVV
ncbi:MAG: hypothetical protein HW400_109 [Candidatus Levybacteria bacterium]|nr:hypothetical protein [Candidatus Levybacteria bacterium]